MRGRRYTQPVLDVRPFRCADCERFARELEDALRSDERDIRARFQATARAAGVSTRHFALQWVTSLARMPDDEFETLQSARYPHVADVRRRWEEHAASAGHPTLGSGWRTAFIVDVVMRSGYGGLRRRRDARD